jgi:hypothetical protein
MMRFEKLARLITDLHYEWDFEVRDVDVEKAFGRVWVDIKIEVASQTIIP